MAIAGFVLSFMYILGILGFIFSLIGLSHTKNGKMKGRGLAIAGVAIGGFWIFIIGITILWAAIIPMMQSQVEPVVIANTGSLESDEYISQGFIVHRLADIELLATTNNPANIMILQENEFYRYEEGKEYYYLKGSFDSKRLTLSNTEISPGNYYLIIEGIDDPVNYQYSIIIE
ncbi:MAG: hypothetical protein A2Y10_13870 [Planctomycetes bacterium GWF2_41_51]|nr:MAG: hypothetical protein A2Y10_13870 [Planctomycetes bacterium GWF2_41_51]HBG25962.1 hypothetical protein [Phycisphaerales bacterium]